MSAQPTPVKPSAGAAVTADRPVFPSVLCGIDGSRADAEAARQAAILAGPSGKLELLAVSWEAGFGPHSQALLSHRRAGEALAAARGVVRELGMEPVIRELDSESETDVLLAEAARYDLLVVGTHGATRARAILLGATSSAAVHRAPCPVLVARRPPEGVGFPQRILLADDGSPSAREAARIAAALAARHAARVEIISPPMTDGDRSRALAEDATAIIEATSVEPVLVGETGHAHHAIVEAARQLDTSLIVIGSRGLHGLPALASVSERVAHQAPCSVLVVRSAGS